MASSAIALNISVITQLSVENSGVPLPFPLFNPARDYEQEYE
jgi:hypothetical protein